MKHMKKSMFITTIVMVAVLVVALSTSTFAWYTAQSNVSATNTTVTSATSTAASIALDKTNTGASAKGSSVTLTMPGNITPMIPKASPEAGVTTYSVFSGGTGFNVAPIDNAGNFTADGIDTTPSLISQVAVVGQSSASETSEFYVINTNGTNETEVEVAISINTDGYTKLTSRPNDWVASYTAGAENSSNAKYYTRQGTGVDGDNFVYSPVVAAVDFNAEPTVEYFVKNEVIASDLRVALFSDNLYVGTWATTAATHYGEIVNQNLGSDFSTYNATTSGGKLSLNKIAPLGARKIQLAVWFDGVTLTIDDAGMPAVFSISFNIA